MSLSNTFETRTLQWLFSTASVTRPTVWYVGLFTSNPGEASGGTEVSGGNYAREVITFTISDDLATNDAAIEFNVPSADWGTISHVAVFDALTGGNQIAYAALATARTINNGDVIRFPAGDLDITIN